MQLLPLIQSEYETSPSNPLPSFTVTRSKFDLLHLRIRSTPHRITLTLNYSTFSYARQSCKSHLGNPHVAWILHNFHSFFPPDAHIYIRTYQLPWVRADTA